MRTQTMCLFVALLAFTSAAHAAVQTKTVPYKVGQLECVGYLAWDDAVQGRRPGVLVVHEWWGLNEYARSRAEQLASLGYVAFAADIYGEGKTAKHPQEAGQMAAMVRENVEDWRERATTALDVLRKQPQCDPERLAAIGYCFGGSTALQLAYTGADLDAVVTFHGALPVPSAEEAGNIKGTVMICHGADDSFIPEETIQEFRSALDEAQVDWQMVYYAGAQHSFTVPSADEHGIDGIKYDKKADRRSWQQMLGLFREKFGGAPQQSDAKAPAPRKK